MLHTNHFGKAKMLLVCTTKTIEIYLNTIKIETQIFTDQYNKSK